jgi:hypothetical protein
MARRRDEHCIIALHVACTDMFEMTSNVFSTMNVATKPWYLHQNASLCNNR